MSYSQLLLTPSFSRGVGLNHQPVILYSNHVTILSMHEIHFQHEDITTDAEFPRSLVIFFGEDTPGYEEFGKYQQIITIKKIAEMLW